MHTPNSPAYFDGGFARVPAPRVPQQPQDEQPQIAAEVQLPRADSTLASQLTELLNNVVAFGEAHQDERIHVAIQVQLALVDLDDASEANQ